MLEKDDDKAIVNVTNGDKKKHGTKITLNNVRDGIDTESLNKVTSDLQEIYRRFTDNNNTDYTKILNLILYFNGKQYDLNATGETHKILNAKEVDRQGNPTGQSDILWEKDIKFSYQKNTIKGYIAIRETGSYTKNPGLCFFRNNRLIVGLKTTPYMPL